MLRATQPRSLCLAPHPILRRRNFPKTGQQTGRLGSRLGNQQLSCAIDQAGKTAGNPKWQSRSQRLRSFWSAPRKQDLRWPTTRAGSGNEIAKMAVRRLVRRTASATTTELNEIDVFLIRSLYVRDNSG